MLTKIHKVECDHNLEFANGRSLDECLQFSVSLLLSLGGCCSWLQTLSEAPIQLKLQAFIQEQQTKHREFN